MRNKHKICWEKKRTNLLNMSLELALWRECVQELDGPSVKMLNTALNTAGEPCTECQLCQHLMHHPNSSVCSSVLFFPFHKCSLRAWSEVKWREGRSVVSDSLRPHGLSMEFSRPEYWSGLPFPSPGDLTNPGIEPRSPALQADSLPAELSREAIKSGGWIENLRIPFL